MGDGEPPGPGRVHIHPGSYQGDHATRLLLQSQGSCPMRLPDALNTLASMNYVLSWAELSTLAPLLYSLQWKSLYSKIQIHAFPEICRKLPRSCRPTTRAICRKEASAQERKASPEPRGTESKLFWKGRWSGSGGGDSSSSVVKSRQVLS